MFNETKAVRQPTNPDVIALIDADTVAYAVCSVCEAGDDEAGYTIDMDYALKTAIEKIQGILDATGCGKAELHFTAGKNFRYSLTDSYKANRTGQRTPEGLSDLKKLLIEEYEGSIIHSEIEADDYVVWAKKYFPDKYILCAVDKDVYNSVSGKHWNYYKNEKYNIESKWVETMPKAIFPWFCLQVLMGDSGDGIPGIPKCGPDKAFKVLAPNLVSRVAELKKNYKEVNKKPPGDIFKHIIEPNKLLEEVEGSEFEMWERVVKAYEAAGMTVKDAILTARLVSMHQLNEKGDLDLWIPPTE